MTDEEVARLVTDLRPVRRLASPGKRAALFAIFAALVVGGGVGLAGTRADLLSKLSEPAFVVDTALVASLFGCSAVAALQSAIPGERSAAARATVVVLAAWLFSMAVTCRLEPQQAALALGVRCLERIVVLSLPPALVLIAMLRRAAPLRAGISGLLALLASSSAAVLGTRALCSKDDGLHLLLWHFGPVMATTCVGILVGRLVLRRQSRGGVSLLQ